MKKINWVEWVGILFLWFAIFVVIGLPLYSNYSACKEYFSKMNPIMCMLSTKTKAVGN